jgi:hypothetical protein
MVEPLERPLSSYIRSQFVTADENTSVAEAVKLLQLKMSRLFWLPHNHKAVDYT